MRIGVSMPGRRRDPWWVGGRTVRRRSPLRRLMELVVVVLTLALLWAYFAARANSVFGASGGSVNLDQWATKAVAWQNGNLNGNNAAYPEGGIVPFRLAVEGLTKGSHTIHINYDFTAGGHKAYDFLATWNGWSKPGSCATSGGGISEMCPNLPASSSFPFPSDPYVANGLPVRGAEAYSGVSRRLTIWGGTITSISGPVHSGSPEGNSTADFTVRFTATGPSVLLAWGGHLAQSAFWDTAAGGQRDGAGEVSGAPWHMRTLQLDGAGNKNQDRSIQPSAIVGELPPFALAPPTPTPRPTPVPQAPAPTPAVVPNPPAGPATPGSPPAPGAQPPGAPVPGGGTSVSPPPTSVAAAAGGMQDAAVAVLLLTLLVLATTCGLAVAGPRRARSR